MVNTLYKLYRTAKRIPGVAPIIHAVLRLARNLFWYYRPASRTAVGKVPESYLSFVESEIDDKVFTLIEVGAGQGRILSKLATRFPAAQFIGVDIHRAAVSVGNAHMADAGISNVRLVCISCLDDSIDWKCDYLISRAALIYLNRREIEVFLRKRLPQVRRKMLLEEIISLSEKTETSHFFANPLPALVEKGSNGNFLARITILDYVPWKRAGHWSGADIVAERVRTN